MTDPRIILAALGTLCHVAVHTPAETEAFLVRAKLVEYACDDAHASDHGVSCAIVHAVAWQESTYRTRGARTLLGCRPYGSDDWRQARCAVRSLITGVARCRSVGGALSRYVSQLGVCVIPRGRRYRRERARVAAYVGRVERVARAIGGLR